MKAHKRTGHADDEGADGKGAELGVHGADADHRSGHVHVADRHPFTAHGAAHQVLGQQGNHDKQRQAEQVLGQRAFQRQTEHLQVGHRHRARRRVVGEPLDAQKHPVGKELRRQRGHRQVQALDAQTGQAEQHAEQHGSTHRPAAVPAISGMPSMRTKKL